MAIVVVGINLAKNVFAVYQVDEAGRPDLTSQALLRPCAVEHGARGVSAERSSLQTGALPCDSYRGPPPR